MRSLAAAATLAWLPLAPALGGAAPFHEPNAVVLNITEEDLNRIVRDLFHANGGGSLEGTKERLSRGVFDFRYRAGLSEPALELGEDGRALLDLDILDAELTVGRIERKVLKRRMQCENARVTLERDRPVNVKLALRFVIEDADLHIVPEEVTLAGMDGFRLKRPSRCRNNPLPEFLMWWIGKGRLKKKIRGLDGVLLQKARDGAASLNDGDGFLAWRIVQGDLPGAEDSVHLYPQTIDTSHGSLLIGLAGSSATPRPGSDAIPGWASGRASQSFLGLSESFLNKALTRAFLDLDGRPREPGGGLRKLLRSDGIYALIPGLRGMEDRDELRLGFTPHRPPTIDFTADRDERAVIGIRLSDVEMTLWEAERWIGSVLVESVAVSVAPYHSRLGGISFDIVENDWRLSSRGVEFDDELLAATLQEMLFGEVFETRFDPVGVDTFEVGDTRFDPRYFNLIGHHLVVGLAGS